MNVSQEGMAGLAEVDKVQVKGYEVTGSCGYLQLPWSVISPELVELGWAEGSQAQPA